MSPGILPQPNGAVLYAVTYQQGADGLVSQSVGWIVTGRHAFAASVRMQNCYTSACYEFIGHGDSYTPGTDSDSVAIPETSASRLGLGFHLRAQQARQLPALRAPYESDAPKSPIRSDPLAYLLRLGARVSFKVF